MAEKAASVTHGGNGVWGGVYVACAISLAFVEPNLESVLEKALHYIPQDCEYARVSVPSPPSTGSIRTIGESASSMSTTTSVMTNIPATAISSPMPR